MIIEYEYLSMNENTEEGSTSYKREHYHHHTHLAAAISADFIRW